VEDSAEIGLKMQNGALGSVRLDYNQQPPSHCWEIVGSHGTMKWDNSSGTLDVFSAGEKTWKAYPPPPGFERNAMFIEELRHFMDVIRKKASPVCTLEDGKQALRLALAAHASNAKGTLVKLG
jgi:predicted dehydrogenase